MCWFFFFFHFSSKVIANPILGLVKKRNFPKISNGVALLIKIDMSRNNKVVVYIEFIMVQLWYQKKANTLTLLLSILYFYFLYNPSRIPNWKYKMESSKVSVFAFFWYPNCTGIVSLFWVWGHILYPICISNHLLFSNTLWRPAVNITFFKSQNFMCDVFFIQ